MSIAVSNGMTDPFNGRENFTYRPGRTPTDISQAPYDAPGQPLRGTPATNIPVPSIQTARPGRESNACIQLPRLNRVGLPWMRREPTRPGDVLWMNTSDSECAVGSDENKLVSVGSLKDANDALARAPFFGTSATTAGLTVDVRTVSWSSTVKDTNLTGGKFNGTLEWWQLRGPQDGKVAGDAAAPLQGDNAERFVISNDEWKSFDKKLPVLCHVLEQWKPDGIVMTSDLSTEVAGAMGRTHELYNVAVHGYARVNNGMHVTMYAGKELQVFDPHAMVRDTLYVCLVVHKRDSTADEKAGKMAEERVETLTESSASLKASKALLTTKKQGYDTSIGGTLTTAQSTAKKAYENATAAVGQVTINLDSSTKDVTSKSGVFAASQRAVERYDMQFEDVRAQKAEAIEKLRSVTRTITALDNIRNGLQTAQNAESDVELDTKLAAAKAAVKTSPGNNAMKKTLETTQKQFTDREELKARVSSADFVDALNSANALKGTIEASVTKYTAEVATVKVELQTARAADQVADKEYHSAVDAHADVVESLRVLTEEEATLRADYETKRLQLERAKDMRASLVARMYGMDSELAGINVSIERANEAIKKGKAMQQLFYLRYEYITARRLNVMVRDLRRKNLATDKKKFDGDTDTARQTRRRVGDRIEEKDWYIFNNCIGAWRLGTVNDSRASATPSNDSQFDGHSLALTVFLGIRWIRLYDLRAMFAPQLGENAMTHRDGGRVEDYGRKKGETDFALGGVFDVMEQRRDRGSKRERATEAPSTSEAEKKKKKEEEEKKEKEMEEAIVLITRTEEEDKATEVETETPDTLNVDNVTMVDLWTAVLARIVVADVERDRTFFKLLRASKFLRIIFLGDLYDNTINQATPTILQQDTTGVRVRLKEVLYELKNRLKASNPGRFDISIKKFIYERFEEIKDRLHENLTNFASITDPDAKIEAVYVHTTTELIMSAIASDRAPSAKLRAGVCNTLFSAMPDVCAPASVLVANEWGDSLVDKQLMQTLVNGRAKFTYEDAERNKTGWMGKMLRANRLAFGVPKNEWRNNATVTPPAPVDAGVRWLLEAAIGISTSARDAMQLSISMNTSSNMYDIVDSYRAAYIELAVLSTQISSLHAQLSEARGVIQQYAISTSTVITPIESKQLNDTLTALNRSLEESRSAGRAVVDRVWKSVRAAPLEAKWNGIVAVPSVSTVPPRSPSSSVDSDGFTMLRSDPQPLLLPSSSDGGGTSTSSSDDESRRVRVAGGGAMPPPLPRAVTPKRRNVQRK